MSPIVYGFLLFLSVCIAWQFGMAGHGSVGHLLVFAVMMGGAYYFLTRRLCLACGAIGLILGSVGPAAVWAWGSVVIKGDPSGYGMFGTLLAYVLIPVGLGLVIVGWLKKQ